MDSKSPEISLVVPVFNEAGNLAALVSRVTLVLEDMNRSFEIVFAVDPSTDGSDEIIFRMSSEDPRIRAIVFSRRVGQPTATLAGLESCSGNAAIVMDCDLQDPPELIPQLIEEWERGFDVVYARRTRREGETLVKRVVAKVGYAIIDRFGDVKIPRDTGDFRLLSRRVIDQLAKFPETHGFLRGLVALVGFSQTEVTFERPSRYSGQGHYNRFFGSLRIGFNGVIAFSSALLNLSTILGFAAAGGSFVFGSIYLALKGLGVNFPIGNPTLVVAISLIGGLQLICLGITGQYIGRIYDEVKRRPRYIIDYEILGGKRS